MRSKSVKISVTLLILLIGMGTAVFFLTRGQSEEATTTDVSQSQPTKSAQGGEMSESNQDRSITINVGSESYEATLADNETSRAFQNRLPLSLDMGDVNNNEKAFDLPEALPSNPANPGKIQNGDLMLFGSRTLVLFYKSFDTSYTYTRIGHIDEPVNLAETLGSGEAEVTFQP